MDTTTAGYSIEPEILAALVEQFRTDVADLADEPDPSARYVALTAEQARLQAIHDAIVGELKHQRGLAVRQLMKDCGYNQTQAGEALQIGQSRVSQLLAAVRPQDGDK